MKIQRLLAFHRQSVNLLLSEVPCRNITTATRCLSVNPSPALESQLVSQTHQPSLGKWTSVRELYDARVHLGHKEGSLDPRMTPYIWGSRLGHLVLDLDTTLSCLERALDVTREIVARKGIVLFVSSAPSCALPIENAAVEVGEYAHTRPWRQGTLTNTQMIFGAVTRLPDIIISIGSHPALVEAAKMAIPTIAVLDTDCNPSLITYPIPGNDDTPSSVQLYLNLFTRAVLIGKQQANLDKDT